MFSLILHRRFDNASLISLCESTEKKLDNMEKDKVSSQIHSTSAPIPQCGCCSNLTVPHSTLFHSVVQVEWLANNAHERFMMFKTRLHWVSQYLVEVHSHPCIATTCSMSFLSSQKSISPTAWRTYNICNVKPSLW